MSRISSYWLNFESHISFNISRRSHSPRLWISVSSILILIIISSIPPLFLSHSLTHSTWHFFLSPVLLRRFTNSEMKKAVNFEDLCWVDLFNFISYNEWFMWFKTKTQTCTTEPADWTRIENDVKWEPEQTEIYLITRQARVCCTQMDFHFPLSFRYWYISTFHWGDDIRRLGILDIPRSSLTQSATMKNEM